MWYHVTKYPYMGKTKILSPYVPATMNEKEGNIPRICVSNSIFNCLKSIIGRNFIYPNDCKIFKENPCVYFTEDTPFIPPDCVDFRVNDERWFIKKTKFFYLARIDIFKLLCYNKLVPTQDKEIKFPRSSKSITKVKEMFIQNLI